MSREESRVTRWMVASTCPSLRDHGSPVFSPSSASTTEARHSLTSRRWSQPTRPASPGPGSTRRSRPPAPPRSATLSTGSTRTTGPRSAAAAALAGPDPAASAPLPRRDRTAGRQAAPLPPRLPQPRRSAGVAMPYCHAAPFAKTHLARPRRPDRLPRLHRHPNRQAIPRTVRHPAQRDPDRGGAPGPTRKGAQEWL